MRIKLDDEYVDLARVSFIGKLSNSYRELGFGAIHCVGNEFPYECAGRQCVFKRDAIGPVGESLEDSEVRGDKIYHEVKAIRDDMIVNWLKTKGQYYGNETQL